MAISKGKFPAPEDSDGDDVVLALETANALWGRGDSREAIRWLRRAAEAAEEAGNDMRALSLARTAADLTSDLDEAGEAASPSAPVASAPRASKRPGFSLPTRQAKSPDTAVKTTPSSGRTRSEPPRPAQTPPPPPGASSPMASSPSSVPPERSSRRTGPQASSSGRSSAGDRTKDAMAHLAELASGDASAGASPRARRNLGPYQALRVSVEPSRDDRKALNIRILNQSEEAPANAHEAMLISTRPNIDMRSRKR